MTKSYVYYLIELASCSTFRTLAIYFRQSVINVGQSHSLSVIESVKMLVLVYSGSRIVGFYNERQFSGWTVGDGWLQADCEREEDSIPQTFNNNETGSQ